MEQVEGRAGLGTWQWGLIAGALVVSLCALGWCVLLQRSAGRAERQLAIADQKNEDMLQRLEATNARLRATSETLAQSVGLTQRQMELKAQRIALAQAAQALEAKRLEREQAVTSRQIGVVSNDVASVRTDVGGVKTDVASTKADIESTKTQLQRAMGDAGVMSGLIARNHDELEILKHRGDRSYFEFALEKGGKPVMLSRVKLQLKKVDEKRSRYTINVNADDRTIEKKDKSLDEPVQFYTGKDSPILYELVVNSIERNKVSGYLSTPKAPEQTP
jgi:multidrug efflux pump subunit AcrA (membrane-fusion protein)